MCTYHFLRAARKCSSCFLRALHRCSSCFLRAAHRCRCCFSAQHSGVKVYSSHFLRAAHTCSFVFSEHLTVYFWFSPSSTHQVQFLLRAISTHSCSRVACCLAFGGTRCTWTRTRAQRQRTAQVLAVPSVAFHSTFVCVYVRRYPWVSACRGALQLQGCTVTNEGVVPAVQLLMNVNKAGAFNDLSFGQKKAQAVRAFREIYGPDSPELLWQHTLPSANVPAISEGFC